MGHYQRQPCPRPTDFGKERIGWNQRYLGRQDDRGDQDDEQDVLARYGKTGEGVGHANRGQERADHARNSDYQRIAEDQREVEHVPGGYVIFRMGLKHVDRIETAPIACPGNQASIRIGRVNELAHFSARLNQCQRLGDTVDRHVIKRIALVLITVGLGIERKHRAAGCR